MGRLTADPDVRYSQDGKAVARYTLAVDRGKDNGADFIRCVAFERAAEFAEKYLHKGIKIAVTGRIHTDGYEKDGRKVYTTEVWVREHHFCESRSNAQNGTETRQNVNGQGNDRPKANDGFSDGFEALPDSVEDFGLPFN